MRLLFAIFIAVASAASTWAVELADGVDPYDFAAKHGLRFVDSFAPAFHIFEGELRPERARDAVLWAEEQVPLQRFVRRLEDDPLYPLQWHLQAERGVGGGGSTGRGILISIVDDGLQHTHPELGANYEPRYSSNYNGGPHGNSDPTPVGNDGHGTAAAAVAVGVAHNGRCGMGVAPEARVAGVRLIAAPATDLQEAQALSRHADVVHIYSSSWGPVDSGTGIEGPGRLLRQVLARNTAGRIYVWAAGNGRALGDSCAFDGYAGNPYVNAIGATDYDGGQAFYSEGCSNLLAVAPSSGSAAHGIITADLTGPAGYDPSECTRNFGGTSSAAPLAAGVFALLLQVRPSLTWRDLRHVVAETSRTPNKAGYHHSNELGFGPLKVAALLAAAANHTLVPQPQRQCLTDSTSFSASNCNVTFIENAILRLHLHCARAMGGRGSVRIVLRAPSGTTSVLAEPRHADTEEDYPRAEGWAFSSLAFWGESPMGEWQLQVQGCGNGNARLSGVLLGVFGY